MNEPSNLPLQHGLAGLTRALERRDQDMPADTVRLYLNAIGQVPLLTAEEEVNLAKRIAAGRVARQFLDDPGRRDAAARRQLRRIASDGDRAATALTEANLRLVVSVARRYANRRLPLIDVIQEGNIGLMRAVEKFDHTKGFKFSTYASWWIRQMVSRAVADQSRTIRIPVHLVEVMQRLRRTERELIQQIGREPTAEELAAAADMAVERVLELRRIALDPTSLDAPIGEDGAASVSDLLEDPDSTTALDVASRQMLSDQLAKVLEALGDRERDVLTRRFGLGGHAPQTLEQVGVDLELTRERVRQIEVRALAKLRYPQRTHGLKDFLEE